MNWIDHISAVSLQTSALHFDDFLKLCRLKQGTTNLGEITQLIESEKLKSYFNKTPNWQERSTELLKEFRRAGIKYLNPLSENYPKEFYRLQDPPIFLSYIGSDVWAQQKTIAVVGSREPSLDGLQWLEQHLSKLVCAKKITIVSGAARGIDQAAHACALKNQKATIAFLPSGLLQPYPRDFKRWIAKIENFGGAVISEYKLQQPMQSHHFYRRNRLIAGLAEMLLVIEAKRKSGSMMTARLALDSHQNVAALPGSPLDMRFGGNNDLIYDGAQLVRDYFDLAIFFDRSSIRVR